MSAARRTAVRLGLMDEESACVEISESWVKRWRVRQGIKSILFHGEGGDCPNYDDSLKAHRSIIQGYTPRNILNFDETMRRPFSGGP